MTLLRFTPSKIPVVYEKIKPNKNEDSIMDKRNRSILAHGTNPIKERDYRALNSSTNSMILEAIGDKNEFKNLLKKATFPKLDI